MEEWLENWKRKRQRYLELSDELQRAYDREIMCLERAQAAHGRAAQIDFLSFCTEIVAAIFYGGNWPGAESRMWNAYVKRASRYVQSVQKELDAVEFTPLKLSDPASLEAIFGPLVEDQHAPGSEIIFQDGDGQVKQALIRWVFKDNNNGETCYLITDSQPVEES